MNAATALQPATYRTKDSSLVLLEMCADYRRQKDALFASNPDRVKVPAIPLTVFEMAKETGYDAGRLAVALAVEVNTVSVACARYGIRLDGAKKALPMADGLQAFRDFVAEAESARDLTPVLEAMKASDPAKTAQPLAVAASLDNIQSNGRRVRRSSEECETTIRDCIRTHLFKHGAVPGITVVGAACGVTHATAKRYWPSPEMIDAMETEYLNSDTSTSTPATVKKTSDHHVRGGQTKRAQSAKATLEAVAAEGLNINWRFKAGDKQIEMPTKSALIASDKVSQYNAYTYWPSMEEVIAEMERQMADYVAKRDAGLIDTSSLGDDPFGDILYGRENNVVQLRKDSGLKDYLASEESKTPALPRYEPPALQSAVMKPASEKTQREIAERVAMISFGEELVEGYYTAEDGAIMSDRLELVDGKPVAKVFIWRTRIELVEKIMGVADIVKTGAWA